MSETVGIFLPPDLADVLLITIQEAIGDSLTQKEYVIAEKNKNLLNVSKYDFLMGYLESRTGKLLRIKTLITTGITNNKADGFVGRRDTSSVG